ncbi:hypothetical protein [Streptomyces sp. NPDC007905]|uniref:hypothetical protein n=1 Tax=Streptomyces sp. NPDC007905 TaxID=3364788 RepID=UPI0036E74F7A
MGWLTEHQLDGLRAMQRVEWDRRRKLIENLQRVYWEPGDTKVGDERTYALRLSQPPGEICQLVRPAA